MVKVSMEKLGGNIRRMREEKGWSVEELADRVFATVDFVNSAEAGKRKLTLEAVMAFCDALAVSPDELLHDILESD